MTELIYSYPLDLSRKIKNKNSETANEKKAIEENKFTLTIKRLMLEFSLY